jgi:hypothetical protein
VVAQVVTAALVAVAVAAAVYAHQTQPTAVSAVMVEQEQ